MRIRINKINREDKKECVSYDDGIVSAWYGSMVQSKYGMVDVPNNSSLSFFFQANPHNLAAFTLCSPIPFQK